MTPKAQRLVAAAGSMRGAAWIGGVGRAQQPAAAGANGDLTPAISATITTRRSIRSTRPTSTRSEIAWRFKTDFLGPRPEFKLEGTPLMANRHALHHRRHAARRGRASTRPPAS